MEHTRSRWLSLMTLLGMLAMFAGQASAAPGDEWTTRTVATRYTGSGGASGAGTGTVVVGGERYGGVALTPRDDEVLVSLRLRDDTGRPVLAEVSQDRDDAGAPDPSTTVRVCGDTAQPLAIRPGVLLTVRMTVGSCGTAVSTPTQGVVEATFFAPDHR